VHNPLCRISPDIAFDRIRPEHVEPGIDELIVQAKGALRDIVRHDGPRTYDNTPAAIERAVEALDFGAGIVRHLQMVATTPALREAHNAAIPKVAEVHTGLFLDAGLYRALADFAESDEAQTLEGPRRRHLDKLLFEFRRQGARLNDEGKSRLAELDVELTRVTNDFAQNVLDATNAFEIYLDESELAGLPESARAAARQSATELGKEGYRLTLQAPSLLPALTYLDSRAVREKLWRASSQRATGGAHDNRPLVRRILELRDERAKLLGYSDFADLTLADRMAKKGSKAREFIRELRERTQTVFEQERRGLSEFKETTGDAAPLEPWDVAYFSEKQRRARFDFDDEELRPYFSVEAVLAGLFETAHRLYGVTVESTTGVPTWSREVRTYRLRDEDGAELARFFVDLHPRSDKRGGAWMNNLWTGVAPEPHVALICANLTPPVDDGPALLTHREVETLFHEFGHLMHQCLSRVPVRALAGANVAWDFVELPSQIMENWCWERAGLDAFARHHETKEHIPDVLFERLVRTRTYRAASAQMQQLGYAEVDLALHCDLGPDDDVMTLARDIASQHTSAALPSDYAQIASFTHLFASPVGYGAGYYSYKWAEVLEADAFSRFREHGLFDETVGASFRDQVLARGDSEDAGDLFRAFVGRDPSVDALLQRQGLA